MKYLTGLLMTVSVAAVIGHIFHLHPPPGMATPPGLEFFESQIPMFENYPIATNLHLIFALVFILLIPLQFSKPLRVKKPALHRAAGKVFLLASFIVAASGVYLGVYMPFGGTPETIVTVIFGAVFVCAFVRAFQYIKIRNITLHRQWMIRGVATGLAIASMRMIDGTLYWAHWFSDRDTFTVSLALGIVLNLVVAEMYIRRGKALP